MKWTIVGAGAIGGYLGARLQAAGLPVSFIVRQRRRRQLAARGLRVESPGGSLSLIPSLCSPDSPPPETDIALLAVKGQSLPDILPWLDRLPATSFILPFLNGVEHIPPLRERYGQRVLGGVAYIEVTLNQDGDVVHPTAMEQFLVGAWSSDAETVLQNLSQDFGLAGLNHRIVPQIGRELWMKYLFLDSFSLLTATTGLPIGDILQYPVCHQLARTLIAEALRVGRHEQPDLADDAADRIYQRLCAAPAAMTSSMARDKSKGLPLEADHLQGGLIRLAEQHRVAVPAHQALFATLAPHLKGRPQP
ncbi:MAG: 2-dehydropantoate 2-reductase [Thermaerobacter sp.]|nr:2-dehydropantoate 2-reductase [Thermaerobacter sp.]